jgi:hypothetical protein
LAGSGAQDDKHGGQHSPDGLGLCEKICEFHNV